MLQVKDLIEKLKDFDPMLPVLVFNEKTECVEAENVTQTSRDELLFGHFGKEDNGVLIS